MPDVSKYIPGKKETSGSIATPITFPGFDVSDCILAHEKEYGLYGTQYPCWVNPKIMRADVLKKTHNGAAITFRQVPFENGIMYLVIDYASGLDFAVLLNPVARKLRYEYYNCFALGTITDKSVPRINLQIWQPPGVEL